MMNSALLLLLLVPLADSFSMTMGGEKAILAHNRLREALVSPSGKITLSPEVLIPEPTDPTLLLLQGSEIQKLSRKIRIQAKANAVFISGTTTALRTFATEQEEAKGYFPGPLPIIYCPTTSGECDYDDISDAGASAVLLPVLNGKEISSAADVSSDDLKTLFQTVLENGLQPIPECVISANASWEEEDVQALIDALIEQCGMEPTAVVLTLGLGEESEEEDDEDATVSLPAVSATLRKKIPILGSVSVLAGGGRLGGYTAILKNAGFTGSFLRSDCVPGFRMNPDLAVVADFWAAAISDLKSTKSKTFSFRSKISLGVDVPKAWYDYQKNVMESGALGETSMGQGDVSIPDENGDFKGF